MSFVTYQEVLNRAETGPLMKEGLYDRKVGQVARELVKKYNIKFDPENIVNSDDALADRVFEAALDFIVELGVYVTDYERIIQFTKDEVIDTIANVRPKVQYGRNKDAAIATKRAVEDSLDPFIAFSPVGNPVDEEVFVKFIMHYAKERITDALFSPVLTKFRGQPVKSDVSSEMEASIQNLKYLREAARLVGRPDVGLCNWASTAEKTDVVIALADPAFGSIINDGVLNAAIAEMKVDQERLKKVSYLLQKGFIIEGLLGPLFGGYAGGVEGTAICHVAHHFLAAIVYRTDINIGFPIHINYCCNTTPEMLWLTAIINQALARNCNILKLSNMFNHAGPNTEMCMLEAINYGATATVSGADAMDLGALTMNRHPMRWAVEEPKMAAEVGHIVARMGLTRKEVNEFVKKNVAEYKPLFGSMPLGSRWDECYDTDKLIPKNDYADLVAKMKKKMTDYGLDWSVLKVER